MTPCRLKAKCRLLPKSGFNCVEVTDLGVGEGEQTTGAVVIGVHVAPSIFNMFVAGW